MVQQPAEEILVMRQEDLMQRQGENLVEYRNRAARFEKEVENFQKLILDQPDEVVLEFIKDVRRQLRD